MIEFVDNHSIGFFYNLREQFKIDLEFAKTEIINEGALKCEDFLFWLWVRNHEILMFIKRVENHEGAWEFDITNSNTVQNEIEYIFNQQGMDCQLTVNLV